MNETRQPHDMLDDVAVYALGAMPPDQARRVREHIATCDICREEYEALRPVTTAVGYSAETAGNAANCPSTLLKPRIMKEIRASAARSGATPAAKPSRVPVWPAYLVAAACLAIAIFSSIGNIALTGQLKSAQSQLARESQRSTELARDLASQRATLSDLLGTNAKRYAYAGGEVVARGNKVYIAMTNLAQPPHGKVYQAWTLAKGAKQVAPSLTFVPDPHGVAVVTLPNDARSLAAVAVSVEPEGGSKQPTTKPIVLVPLT